jgi:hypothetical protein
MDLDLLIFIEALGLITIIAAITSVVIIGIWIIIKER